MEPADKDPAKITVVVPKSGHLVTAVVEPPLKTDQQRQVIIEAARQARELSEVVRAIMRHVAQHGRSIRSLSIESQGD